MINCIDSLSFDDLMLIPKYSTVLTRSKCSTAVELCKGFKFDLPFVPSNMKHICELKMALAMYKRGGMAIFHRFTDLKQQLEWLENVKTWGNDALKFIGFSVGVKDHDREHVKRFVENGAKIICIDIAHGDSTHGLEMTAWVATTYPDVLLISGNAAMGEGAARIWKAGADICKVGIGGGSICTTRINTGNGVPSMTSLSSCYDIKNGLEKELGRKLFIMNDGGTKSSGDLVKALCFADLCMAGNLFAASSCTPGEIITKINEHEVEESYKEYSGSSTHRGSYTEGVKAIVKYKGETDDIITALSEGIRSGMSYQGVNNLRYLKYDPHFVKLTPAGFKESGAHDVKVTK